MKDHDPYAGGGCRCDWCLAQSRNARPEPTMEEILTKLHRSGVDLNINGMELKGEGK